ncbi:reverse transcriptase domain-containing protein [Alicyclobacillus sp. ALC3]|uniref:reverse transcriptase domain-containing protein n=1 Tax=Alicyclobacillus sp. ALC3 TaxID=2796143 RepID=UPI002378B2F0|nr:reverse transcriptase domain-containing protein [Alicyclobacillus sp. ALC3]WDL98485.1 reverse transcriptase [Alicyclobacillus sp. ALC3]
MDIKKYRIKGYTHFDRRVPVWRVARQIVNPSWVAVHGFFPFIHFQLKSQKYIKDAPARERKPEKIRDIYYASHLDGYIFKYYGELLNQRYNEAVIQHDIDDVVTAYRSNKSGKSNIHFAKEVIDFIKRHSQVFILVSDFEKYFDTLEHSYLKKRVKHLLGSQTLPPDFYAVFKAITQFSWIELEDIEQELKVKYTSKELRSLNRLFDDKEFRDFKSRIKVGRNRKGFGIPQGASISAVLSNVYLLEFDIHLKKYAQVHGGLYRRYCDDLILAIPVSTRCENAHEVDFVLEQAVNSIPHLSLQAQKTKHYIFENGQMLDIDNGCEKASLDYLGFSFNGEQVKIREKSLFKYYSRAYRKVRSVRIKSEMFGRKAYRKKLYSMYTHMGKRKKGRGNFLSYASKAQAVFDENATTINLMETQVKRHWVRIQRRLNQPDS